MADISEILANSDPETLRKLLEMRDATQYGERFVGPAERSAEVFSKMPRTAAESAEILAGAPEPATDYGKIFGKQVAQDIVDAGARPGRTAAESAEVFSKALPEGIAEGQNLVPYTGRTAGPSMLSRAGSVLSKAALPASIGYELLKSGPMDENEDNVIGLMREAYARANGRVPEDRFEDVKALSDNSSQLPGYFSEPYQVDDDVVQRDPSSVPGAPSSPAAQQRALRDKFTGRVPVESRMDTGEAISKLLGMKNEQLASAQNLQNNLRLLAGMQRAGETIGAAFAPLSKAKPDDDFYKAQLAGVDQPVQNILQKQNLEDQQMRGIAQQQALKTQLAKSDPNSDISRAADKFLRYNAAKLGLKDLIPSGALTANEADDLQKIVAQEAARKDQSDLKRILAGNAAEDRKIKLSDAQEKHLSDLRQKFSKSLSADSASSRSAMGRAALGQQQAEKIETLIHQYKDSGQLSKQQIYEIANAFDSMLKGGVSTVSGVEHLIPRNMLTDSASIEQYISSVPVGAQQQAFVKRLAESVANEKKTATGQLDRYLKPKGLAFKELKEKDPDSFHAILQGGNEAAGVVQGAPQVSRAPSAPAEETGPHGPSVTQNGHTYMWDPKEKKYK